MLLGERLAIQKIRVVLHGEQILRRKQKTDTLLPESALNSEAEHRKRTFAFGTNEIQSTHAIKLRLPYVNKLPSNLDGSVFGARNSLRAFQNREP